MFPNGVLFENDEFSDDYINWQLPSLAPLTANYYSNGVPVSVTATTSYPIATLDGFQVEQFTGVNSDGERTCSVEFTQFAAFSTGLLQHQCAGVNSLIITPPERPPEPVDPWSVVKWTVKPSPGEFGLTRVVFSDGKFITTGPAYSRTYRTTNGDTGEWRTVRAAVTIPFCHTVVEMSGDILVPAFDNRLYKSSNNGVSYVETATIIDDVDFVSLNRARAWEANGWVLISTLWAKDVGDGETGPVYSNFVTSNGVDLIEIDVEENFLTGFAYKDGTYYIAVSDGTVWSSSDPTAWINNGTYFPVSDNFEFDRVFRVIDGVFVASDQNKILTTNNPALGWTVVNATSSPLIREVIKVDTGIYFAITSGFVYKRSSDLVNWTDLAMPYGGVWHAAYGNDIIMVVHEGGYISTLEDDT